jgi:uncharacterized protein with HEPN domain
MKRLDEKYVLDMLLSARQALEYVDGTTRDEFLEDTRTQDAVLRRLEVIGEAATRVSGALRDRHPDIPWRAMAGMRNRLIHEYFRVDLDVVWVVVREELLPLAAALEPLIPSDQSNDAT